MVLRDSTERKRVEDAQQRRETRFRALIERGNDVVQLSGPDGTVYYMSPAVERLTGFRPDEIVGQPGFDFLHPDDVEKYRALREWLVQRPGESLLLTYPVRRKDGGWQWLEVTVTNDLQRPGVEALVFTYRDLTEHAQVKAALFAGDVLLRTVVTNLPMALFAMDQEGVLTVVEGKALTGLGMQPGEAVGCSIGERFHDLPELERQCRQALTGEPISGTLEVGTRGFETRHEPLRTPDGQVVGVVTVALDITDRWRAEEALRERARREAALAELDQWALAGAAIPDLVQAATTLLARELDLPFAEASTVLRAHGPLDGHATPSRALSSPTASFVQRIARAVADAGRRQCAEDELRRRAEEFRALAENAPDIIARFDRELHLVYVNPTVEAMIGRTADSLIGHRSRGLGLPAPAAASLEVALRQVLRSARERTLELRLPTPSGERDFQLRLVPELAVDESVLSVISIARDVTERRQADAERAELYRALVEQQRQLGELISRTLHSHDLELRRTGVLRVANLTPRDREILQLVVAGWTNPQIGIELHLSTGTIRNHVARILRKLDVSDRTQAAARAVELGLATSTSG
jgi:PAS domain S-box-containing protein